MNFEAMHAIANCVELTTHQKSFLLLMCMHSKRENYDAENDIIKNITISNVSLMKKMSCGRSTVYDTAAFFKEKGILINLKEEDGTSNNYIMIVGKIKDMPSHQSKPKKAKQEDDAAEEKLIHIRPVAGPTRPVAGPTRPVAGPTRPVAGPNNNNHNNKYNNKNNKDFFLHDDFKFSSMAHTEQLLNEKLDILLADGVITDQFLRDCRFTEIRYDLLHNKKQSLERAFNSNLKLLIDGRWETPYDLQNERMNKAREADDLQRQRAINYRTTQSTDSKESMIDISNLFTNFNIAH